MRKKYLSALLFGALLVTSAGTFTSCKDYDDEINNLQEQVDQQKSLTEKLTAVETSIKNLEAAQTEANNAISAAQEAADKAQQAGDAALAAAEEAKLAAAKAQEAAIEAAKKELDNLKAELVEMINSGDAANSEAIQAVNVELTTVKGQIEALMAFQSTTETTLKSLAEADAALSAQIGELEAKVEENALAIGKLEAAIKAQETALEAYKSSNDAEIAGLKTELSDLKSLIEDLTSDTGNIAGLTQEISTLKSSVTDLNNKISKINENLAVLYTAVYEGVTGVSFYTGQYNDDWQFLPPLNSITLQSSPAVRTWTFGEGDVENPVKFVKGEKVNLEYKVMVRVSPANAVVNPENIQIIDTKCNDLVAEGLINIKEVKAYDDVMTTRASVASNGLYNITFELGENYSDEAWKEATKYNGESRKFALSIKCDYKDAEGNVNVRNVVSEYAMAFEIPTEIEMQSSLGFTVDEKNVEYIRNRYSSSNLEYVWKDGVAAEPIFKGEDMNVKLGDNRSNYYRLPVVANKPFEIQLDEETMKTATYFYVVVDYDCVSKTDEDSELIAWKAIEEKTTGINKMYNVAETKGKAEISINYDNLNDEIGFRVYAVNSDGTLVDPDGRSFYVQVGEDSQEITGISTSIDATEMTSDFIPVSIPNITSYNYHYLDTQNKINDNITQSNVFDLTYYDANKNIVNINSVDSWKNVKFIKVSFNRNLSILDDYAYQGKLTIFGDNNREVASLNITATKKLPTNAPEDFSPKTNQIVNGLYTCYVLPEGVNSTIVGQMDLGNVFNGLDNPNYEFTFAGSKLGANQKVEDLVVKFTQTDGYVLNVDKSFVGKADLHKSTIKYNYGYISYVLNKDGYIENKEHKVSVSIDGSTSFNTKYACVYDVQSWSWVNEKNNTTNNTLVYGKVDGSNTTLSTARIQGSNSYDNLNYGVTLDKQIHKDNLTYESIELYSKKDGAINLASKNEYFTPSMNNGSISFLFNSTATTPTADVPSVLRITYTDKFGHDVVIDLDITIKKDK